MGKIYNVILESNVATEVENYDENTNNGEYYETDIKKLKQLFKENLSLLENKFIKDIYDSLEENRKKRQRKRKGTP